MVKMRAGGCCATRSRRAKGLHLREEIEDTEPTQPNRHGRPARTPPQMNQAARKPKPTREGGAKNREVSGDKPLTFERRAHRHGRREHVEEQQFEVDIDECAEVAR